MDKPLPDNDKKENREGGYNPALTEETFAKSNRAWKDSAAGRAVIRLFSRGLMGAAFFTAGGLLNRRWMHSAEETLTKEALVREGKYDATKGFSEQKNPLQFIAKAIDTFIGKPIEFIVTAVAGKDVGKNAVRFRPTKYKDAEAALYSAIRAERSEALWAARTVRKEALQAVKVNPGDETMQQAWKATGEEIKKLKKMPLPKVYRGRSLGNETVAVTFDFFCASIGDALGRDIADFFDPHVEKKWLKHGHVDYKEAAKSAAKSAWRYVTYNGGEDWAVAIPYVYFMKGQRSLINHFSPGFMYDFDRNLNGGSFKVDANNNIIGNYNIEGALDLQSRFTVYNMGTLMYRELYDYTARKMQGKKAVLWGAPDRDTSHETLGEKIGNVFKWMARSVVKGGIYMTPATPFFWITRTPQTNYRGLFIHTDHTGKAMTLNYENQVAKSARLAWLKAKRAGKAVGSEPQRKYENVYASELDHGINPYKELPPDEPLIMHPNKVTGLDYTTPIYRSSYAPDPKRPPNRQFEWIKKEWVDPETNPVVREFPFDAYADRASYSIVQHGFNKIGDKNYRLTHATDGVAEKLDNWAEKNPSVGGLLRRVMSLRGEHPKKAHLSLKGAESFKRFMHPFINASVSYTPYMYMKAEAAKLWDTGKMDYALEHMIDGAAGLNWGEFKAGVSDTTNAILHHPFTDPEREKEAQRRTQIDTSQSAGVNRADTNGNGNGDHTPELSWRERIVQGKPEESLELNANKRKSHAEKEELRDLLAKSTPPTNSIN